TMHFDPSRSLEALGLSPRPVRESLEDAVTWLRQVGQVGARRGPRNSNRDRPTGSLTNSSGSPSQTA
ncbi:hypothetical protein ACYOEI_05280, partial [Singulisphaera rosea]